MIVHLGLGAFHRAHQAVYTQDAGGWAICGVARRRHTVVDALRANHWRYTVISRGPDADEERSVEVIRDALVAADEPDAVIERIASPETHIVTLTITESGYERGGMLDLLGRGIEARSTPLTVLSCDNVPRNGEVLRHLLGAPEHVAFPCTMVDRIVPTPTDPLTVVAEPFSQWVIEDFDGPRPAWEDAGAQIVQDTAPFELMKLRLLNGSHTALAALGIPKGHTTVAEAIADPELEAFIRRLLEEELLPTIPPVPGIDLGEYVETMLARFRNPRIEHRLEKIAAGAEDKIAQRLRPAAAELANPVLILRVIAAAGF